jgi:DNA replication and repair protein RecF
MPIRRLRARTFRNLEDARLEIPDGVTLLVGPNGAGKTNLLEALYFGLTGASWRTRAERELISFGADHARVEVEVRSGSQRTELATVAQRSAPKTRRVDGNPPDAGGAGDHVARPAVAVFSPDRLELVKGPPAVRRSHLDRLIAALWPARAESRRRYGRALAQRNALLARIRAGAASPGSLDAWDLELAREGAAVIAARADAVAKLATWYPDLATALGLEGDPELRYAPRSDAADADGLAAELRERRASDVELGRTTHGPHLDELQVTLGGRALRRYGSQGQQRAALLALLFCEREALLEIGGDRPLMLLDDVMSELDGNRRELLTTRLAGGGQALVTATESAHLPESCERFEVRVRDGAVAPLALAA